MTTVWRHWSGTLTSLTHTDDCWQGVDDGSMKRIFGVAMFALGLKTLKSA